MTMDEMQITSAQYINYMGETSSIKATIDGVEMSVPLDPGNRHYAAIMQAVENNELTIQEASE
jgi:hypothetical protein